MDSRCYAIAAVLLTVSLNSSAQSCPALSPGQSASEALSALKSLQPKLRVPEYLSEPCAPDVVIQEPLNFPVCQLDNRFPVEKLLTFRHRSSKNIEAIVYTFSTDDVDASDLLRFAQSTGMGVSLIGLQLQSTYSLQLLPGATALRNQEGQWLLLEDTTPAARGVVAEKMIFEFPAYRLTVGSDDLLKKLRSAETNACVAKLRQ